MSAGDAAAPSETAERAEANQATPSPSPATAKAGGEKELLCTICGLTSCWQSPKNARPPAAKA